MLLKHWKVIEMIANIVCIFIVCYLILIIFSQKKVFGN